MELVLEGESAPNIMSIHYEPRNNVSVYTGTKAVREKLVNTIVGDNPHLSVCAEIMRHEAQGYRVISNPVLGEAGTTAVARREADARYFPRDGLCMAYAEAPDRQRIESFIKEVEARHLPGLGFDWNWDCSDTHPRVDILDHEGRTRVLLKPGVGRSLSITVPSNSRTAGLLLALANEGLVEVAFANDKCGVIAHQGTITREIERARGLAQITLAALGLCASPFDFSTFACTGRTVLVL